MSFTAIFIALLIERFFDCSHLRNWHWYTKYQQLIAQKLSGKSPYVILAATVIPIILLLFIALLLTSNILFGFAKLVISVLVMLYCFGPRNLWADIVNCTTAFSDGNKTDAAEKLKIAFGINETKDVQSMHRQWINMIFIQANRRVFAQVIWFGLTGLLGAVLYRLVSLSVPDVGKDGGDPQVANTARQVESYMDWVSIRALTFTFALGGHFNRVFSIWRAKALQGPEANDGLLLECGMAAMSATAQETIAVDGSAENEEMSLIDRALAITLVVIAVLVFIIP